MSQVVLFIVLLAFNLDRVVMQDAVCSGFSEDDFPYEDEEKNEGAAVALLVVLSAAALALLVATFVMKEAQRKYLETDEPNRVAYAAARFLPFANLTLLILAGVIVSSTWNSCASDRGKCRSHIGTADRSAESKCNDFASGGILTLYVLAIILASLIFGCCACDTCCNCCDSPWEAKRAALELERRASGELPMALVDV